MADNLSRAERSELMSRIRSEGNESTELALLIALRHARIHGWRRHLPLTGCPDFTFRKSRLIIFVDGCFWHGCPQCFQVPKSQVEYWKQKVERNRARDKRVTRELRKAGWRVMRIWECQLKKHPAKCIKKSGAALKEKF
jgi:DNA mismatch endonuclease (patch repair protein)